MSPACVSGRGEEITLLSDPTLKLPQEFHIITESPNQLTMLSLCLFFVVVVVLILPSYTHVVYKAGRFVLDSLLQL